MSTGEQVAIKVYKQADAPNALEKFQRQVSVLQELQQPFVRPDSWLGPRQCRGRPWSDELASMSPGDLFVKLLDYSRDASGQPGQDPADREMYVVTELAECTLQAKLAHSKKEGIPLPREQVHKIAKDIVLSAAGLHAKGFVHLDIKPHNIMLCAGHWKLIDMDGCARIGTTLRLSDSTISFTPMYCAPEFARFAEEGSSIRVSPGLDSWSVGLTIAELLSFQPLLKLHAQRMSAPHWRGRSFLGWLATGATMPVPRGWEADDPDFFELLTKRLLVNERCRKTLAECLAAPYFARWEAEAGEILSV
jgi:serine/threonine protein kinase